MVYCYSEIILSFMQEPPHGSNGEEPPCGERAGNLFCNSLLSPFFIFLKINYLSGKARYKEIYSKFPPYRVYVFTGSRACSKNNVPEGFKQGGMTYCWMIWEKGMIGPTELKWIQT